MKNIFYSVIFAGLLVSSLAQAQVSGATSTDNVTEIGQLNIISKSIHPYFTFINHSLFLLLVSLEDLTGSLCCFGQHHHIQHLIIFFQFPLSFHYDIQAIFGVGS